jgi:hypothetical protein
LAKEFVRQGHEVVLYALLGDIDYTEISKQTGVVFKNLGNARHGLNSNSGGSHVGVFARIITKLFGKLFLFPDILMIPMVKKAICREGKIDLLITIANPHINHFAAALADRSKVGYWIADCGDPFMGNPFRKHPFYFEYFERAWCKRCDFITVPIEEAKDGYYQEYRGKIKVIPQGFDFSLTKLSEYKPNPVPTFGYSGIFYKDLRDPEKFLQYLVELNKPFKFVCYTKPGYLESFKEKLGDRIEIHNYIPREELLMELSKMDFLVNLPNKSGVQQPSKLIDYALTKRPILAVSTDMSEEEKLHCLEFISGDYTHQQVVPDVQRYNIVNVANQFLDLVR